MKANIVKIPFLRTPPAPSVSPLFEKKSFCDGDFTLLYGIYLPKDYSKKKKYPLILFFHGAGERGNDNELQFKNAIGQFFKASNASIYDCIVIAPQCPADQKWVNVPSWTDTTYSTDTLAESRPLAAAVKLIAHLKSTLSIDDDRIYSTGISMGAYATWDLLVRHTDLFAAAIPVCGGADYRYASRLVNVPIFTFHGDSDSVVPPNGTKTMVDKLERLGAKSLTCIYYIGGDHGIWENAFSTEGLFDWLLSHRKSDRRNETKSLP